MDPNKSVSGAWTPMKKLGKKDFKRPAFDLGRISFGSSSSSGGESPLEREFCGTQVQLERSCSHSRSTPACAADSDVLADRDLRENEGWDQCRGKRRSFSSTLSSGEEATGRPLSFKRPITCAISTIMNSDAPVAQSANKSKDFHFSPVSGNRSPPEAYDESINVSGSLVNVREGNGSGRDVPDGRGGGDKENVAPAARAARHAGRGGASMGAGQARPSALKHTEPVTGCYSPRNHVTPFDFVGESHGGGDLDEHGVLVFSPSRLPEAATSSSSAFTPPLREASSPALSLTKRNGVVDLSSSSPRSAAPPRKDERRIGRESTNRNASSNRRSERHHGNTLAGVGNKGNNDERLADCVEVRDDDAQLGLSDSFNLLNGATPDLFASSPHGGSGSGSRYSSGSQSKHSFAVRRGGGVVGGGSSDGGEGSSGGDVAVLVSAPTSARAAGTVKTSVRRNTPQETGEWEEEEGELRWKMEAVGVAASNNPSREQERESRAFSVPFELYQRMYPHQRTGIRWLWGLHQGDMGGILGDDMGLGKTFQVTCFLAGLFATEQASCVLVLSPKSVMRSWEMELNRWLVKATCPKAEVVVVASELSAKTRRRVILNAADGGLSGGGAVLVTTYGMVSANPHYFAPRGSEHKWDYVVLDEGHKIKNSSTRTCKAVHSLPAKRRLLLTGTPVQNNLKELHTVFDWVTFRGLLGPYKEFKRTFSKPIEYGQDKDASDKAVQKSRTRAAELRELLEPYLLQRTKEEIMDEKATTKTEMVVWVALSPKQREIYAAYLGGESVKDVLDGKVSSPLEAIQHLKKVTLHPLVSSFPLNQPWELDPDEPVPDLLRDSSKLSVMLNIVVDACGTGHRVLVFSRFVRMLDIIERCLAASKGDGGAGLRLARIDGTHSDLERQHTIAAFNENARISVCLVSTGAGGTGITLTGADRVILFDPSWNPAEDRQAVDRAYRIGQTRDVVVYRMIAAGTVEEKIYEKQVFKDCLRRTIMGGKEKRKKSVRYFSRAELKQLFTLFPPGACRVQAQLEELHGALSERLEASDSPAQKALSLDGHLDYLCDLPGSYGASAHGDGLPKIAQNRVPGLMGHSNPNGGGASQAPNIAEEEDESDLEEDSDDDDASWSRTAETQKASGGLDEVLEIDFDGPGLNEADSGCFSPGAGVEKSFAKPRARKSRRFSGGGGDGDEDNGVVVEEDGGSGGLVEGGGSSHKVREAEAARAGAKARAGARRKNGKGADTSTAIALDSDSEVEYDYGRGGRSGSRIGLAVPPSRGRWKDGRAIDDDDVIEVLEDCGLPFSPPPPPAVVAASEHTEQADDDNEELGGVTRKREASPFSDSATRPWDCSEFSPEMATTVDSGRERARRWASDTLGISPIAISSPGGDGDDSASVKEEDGQGQQAAGVKAARGAAAGERAKKSAMTEFGMEDIACLGSFGEESVEEVLDVDTQEEKVSVLEYDDNASMDESPTGSKQEAARGEGHWRRQEPLDRETLESAARVRGRGKAEMEVVGGNELSSTKIPYLLSTPRLKDDNGLGGGRWGAPRASLASGDEFVTPDVEEGTDAGGVVRHTVDRLEEEERTATPPPKDYPTRSRFYISSAEVGEFEFARTRPGDDATAGPRSDRSSYETAASAEPTIDVDVSISSGNAGVLGREVLVPVGVQLGEEAGIVEAASDRRGAGGEEEDIDMGEATRSSEKTKSGDLPAVSKAVVLGSEGVVTTVCTAHKAEAERAGYKCLRCRCFAGAEGLEEAQVMLLRAWEKERAGNLYGAMDVCLQAIELCDEDKELHKTIARIGSRMGCL